MQYILIPNFALWKLQLIWNLLILIIETDANILA